MNLPTIPFKWAGASPNEGLDCFGYASHVSTTLGHPAFDLGIDAIAQAYKRYPTMESAPGTLIHDLAKIIGLNKATHVSKGTLVVVRSDTLCLATALGYGGITYMSDVGSVVCPLSEFDGEQIWGAYEPNKLWKIDENSFNYSSEPFDRNARAS